MATTTTINLAQTEGVRLTDPLFKQPVPGVLNYEQYKVYELAQGKFQIPQWNQIEGTAQDGAGCSLTPNGTVTVGPVYCDPKLVAHKVNLCHSDWFNTIYNSPEMRGIDRPEALAASEAARIGFELLGANAGREAFDLAWFGDTQYTALSGVDSLNIQDGYYTRLANTAVSANLETTASVNAVSATYGSVLSAPATTGALGTDEALAIVEYVYDQASLQLRASENKVFHVSMSVFDNLAKSFSGIRTGKSNLQVTQGELGGLPTVSFMGIPVVAHPRWDKVCAAQAALDFSHLIVLTTPDNLVLGLDTREMSGKVIFDEKDEDVTMIYRYALGSQWAESDMVQAYHSK